MTETEVILFTTRMVDLSGVISGDVQAIITTPSASANSEENYDEIEHIPMRFNGCVQKFVKLHIRPCSFWQI